MHPLLTSIKRLGLYLLAWIPLAGLLIFLFMAPGPIHGTEAALVIVPMSVLYAFMCLAAWYTCRYAPLKRTAIGNVLLTHLVGAALVSGLWVGAGSLMARVNSRASGFEGLAARYTAVLPVLFSAGVLIYLLSVAFHYVLIALEDSRAAEARALQASILAREAELKALKAQVNPHFLFNSLNSISALTSVNPGKARDMCVLLADFLRMTLGLGEKTSIPLAEELSLLRSYLAIEKVRFGARLKMDEDVADDSKPCLVPPLLLQPLIENAVTHGIAHLPDGGSIRLGTRSADGRLLIIVENSFDPEAPPRRTRGMGLENVRQRLDARYGREANVSVSAEGERFRVSLAFPAEGEEKAA